MTMIAVIPRTRSRRVRVGPADHGKRMTLDAFDRAEGQEGWSYELSKGVVEVSDVPDPVHLAAMQAVRNVLIVYQEGHPNLVHTVAGSNDCKILLDDLQSERHPDVSVYLKPPPPGKDVWSEWVPAIVVEVVSARSAKRDYEEKPPEYLAFGVAEYWIVDPAKRRMTVMTRWRGQWKSKELRADQKYATPLLPGFSLDLKRVLKPKK